ncbi:LysR family transcriptional regulator [Robbsia sp. KACC 23696]|uniref:winged helix-turn-helix domain-containing protein n=1 Tax=Robbsia sp. KACC 23696 TaxID=3149231 RepID=UPI00325A7DBB
MSASGPHVRFRMRIHHEGSIAIGPGKIALLEAVRLQGSISGAARHLNMSYRRAWMLIDELNRTLASPATHAEMGGQRGGGCVLTPVGEQIIALYRGIEETAYAACASQIDAMDQLLKR